MVDKWKAFEGDLQDLRTSTGTKLPINKTREFETVIAQFLVDLNNATATNTTTANGVKPAIGTELSKINILETRAALPILFISLVSPSPLLILYLGDGVDGREKRWDWEIQIIYGIQ